MEDLAVTMFKDGNFTYEDIANGNVRESVEYFCQLTRRNDHRLKKRMVSTLTRLIKTGHVRGK